MRMLAREGGQAVEIGSSDFRIVAPGRHGHQPGEPQIRTRPNRIDEPRQLLGRCAEFGGFLGKLDLDHYLQRLVHRVQTPCQFFGIDGVDRLEQIRGGAGLVGLEMADQVKLRAGKVGQRRMLGLELLHVVLAKDAQAQIVGFANDLGRKFLGHCDQHDVFALPPGAIRRGANSLLDALQTFSQGHGSIL